MENEGEIKAAKFRTMEGYLADTGKSFLVYEKGPDAVAELKYADIKEIRIKPAGTLYNGEVSFILEKGGVIKYPINSYQQEDFKEMKERLKK